MQCSSAAPHTESSKNDHSRINTSLKQLHQKLNTVTFMKVGFIAAVVLDCISLR